MRIDPSRDQVRASLARIHADIVTGDRLASGVIDETAIRVYLMRNRLVRYLFDRRLDVAAAFLEQIHPAAILDFGCGPGMFFPSCCLPGRRVYATDFALDYARALVAEYQFPIDLVPATEWRHVVPDRSLDAVVALDSLEHNDDIGGLLEAFRTKLRPAGHLIVSGPTENILYRAGRRISGIATRGEYHRQTIRTIAPQVVAAGFAKVSMKRLPLPFLPSLFWVLDFQLAR